MSVALITGAARRLGRSMALSLASRGHDVAIHYNRSEDEARDTASRARAFGVEVRCFGADLLDPDAAADLIPRIAAAMGPLAVLVNNASIFRHDTIHSATMAGWDRHLGSNLRAPFQLIQAFAAQAPAALPDDRGEPVAQALIVNMVDQRVLKPTPDFMTYSLSKAGLWALTRTAAQALSPHIRVNAIGPGPTLVGAHQSATEFAAQRDATILRRGAEPDDIVAALGYLLDAKAVTGQLICVDGGQHLAWQTPDVQAG